MLDFSEADSDDWRWLAREMDVLMVIESDMCADIMKARCLSHSASSAAVLSHKNGLDLYKHHRGEASKSFAAVWNVTFPWCKTQEQEPDSGVSQIADRWLQVFSDGKDNETKQNQ